MWFDLITFQEEEHITNKSGHINEQDGINDTSDEDDSDFSDSDEHTSEINNRSEEREEKEDGADKTTFVKQRNKLLQCDECEYECRFPSDMRRHKIVHMSG